MIILWTLFHIKCISTSSRLSHFHSVETYYYFCPPDVSSFLYLLHDITAVEYIVGITHQVLALFGIIVVNTTIYVMFYITVFTETFVSICNKSFKTKHCVSVLFILC